MDTMPLIKKRGVFWLPAKLRGPAGGPAVLADGPASESLLGALKAARKAVPAKLIEEEAGEQSRVEGDGLQTVQGTQTLIQLMMICPKLRYQGVKFKLKRLKKGANPGLRRSQKMFHKRSFTCTC